MIAFLFGTTVLAWGFTWFAIKLQIGPVPMEVSIFYRFALASLILWAWLGLTGRFQRASFAQHRWLALMGLCLFGLNYVLIYEATLHITSGVVAVLFSAATIFNAFNQWIFMGKRPARRTLVGAAFGIAGIALLFAPELSALGAGGDAPIGIGLALAGTFVFSLGNLVSVRANNRDGFGLPNAVVRGMTWGAAFVAMLALARGRSFALDTSPGYLLSLIYLAIPGSVLGFLAYLSLVARVGADRAAYATVLFPVVALTVSTVLEGFVWTYLAIAGLPLILLGNIVIFRKPASSRSRRAMFPTFGRRQQPMQLITQSHDNHTGWSSEKQLVVDQLGDGQNERRPTIATFRMIDKIDYPFSKNGREYDENPVRDFSMRSCRHSSG